MAESYPFPRSTPEKLGMSSGAIARFLDAVQSRGVEMHTFMLLRHGQVAAEGAWAPYRLDAPHMLFSLSKSVSATGIGLAVQEGLLSVDDLVISFFPEYITEAVAANMANLRIRHLLSMSTGHDVDTGIAQRLEPGGDWIRAFFETPIVHPPGTFFLYNSGGSYMLSAIVQRVTGQTLVDYVRPRLFEPLGIDYALWETCPKGMSEGASGLHMTTDAIARFGQLFLQKGMWNGQRILSEAWVEEASSCHVANNPRGDARTDWNSGYGYQMWQCRQNGAYRGDGAFGQFCIVIPEHDAVIAITSGTDKMPVLSELIWTELYPAFGSGGPIEGQEAEAATAALQERIARLAYAPQEQPLAAAPALAASVSGKRYALEPNGKGVYAAAFEFEPEGCLFRLWDGRGEHAIRCGSGEWSVGETLAAEDEWVKPVEMPWKVAASGAWSDERTYVMTWRYIETTFTCKVVCRFDADGEHAALDFTRNLTFEPYDFPTIRGTAAQD
jgi:CubicO group peptidase (beta-lactamase class C family)